MGKRAHASVLALLFGAAHACAQTTQDDVAAQRDADGGGAAAGTHPGDGGPWPDGPPGAGGGSGSGAGGSSGSGGSSGGAGGGGGGGGGAGGGGGGGTGGGGSGGSGGCSPISCKSWSSCQDELVCAASCPPAPAETCNLADDNCDGACDEGAGCRVGVHRSFNAATGEHFYTTSASEAVCCGFSLQFADAFHLYETAKPGLVAFHRCYLNSGKHFYTTSASCEGAAGVNEGIMGYIATSKTCSSVPLYRLYRAQTGDHFYTTSESEKDTAVASSGYVLESIAGWVWTSG